MIRLLLLRLLIILAPFILYAGYVALIRRENPFRASSWQEAPLSWLAGASILCAVVSIVALGFILEGERNADYRPARFEDGKLVPGRLDPRGTGEPTEREAPEAPQQ
ncbi:MAG: DUF6111 family protein [Alphaproteobacteria bacterium]